MVNSTPIALLTSGQDPAQPTGFPDPRTPRTLDPLRMMPFASIDGTRHPLPNDARFVRLFALCVVFSVLIYPVVGMSLMSCASRGAAPAIREHRGPAQLRIEADWDDVDAAVEVGVGQAEGVVVHSEPSPDGMQRGYQLKHVSGVTGVLTARVEAEGKDPRPIVFTCTMGAMDNGGLAQRILDRIAVRLKDLKGKEVAPIRE